MTVSNTHEASRGQDQAQAKWAALINDVVTPAPQRRVIVKVLKSQARIPDDHILVRDCNSPHDVALGDDAEIDLAAGNVFYSRKRCDAPTSTECHDPAKLAYVVDDRAEITTNPDQTGATVRALFSIPRGQQLVRDLESPNDDVIQADDPAIFSAGPVFVTRSPATVRIIVNARRKDVAACILTFQEVIALAYDDPPTGEFICFTITYRGGPHQNPEGTLVEGDSVHITEGMIFNVSFTDKS